jgi:hypothetical protein
MLGNMVHPVTPRDRADNCSYISDQVVRPIPKCLVTAMVTNATGKVGGPSLAGAL